MRVEPSLPGPAASRSSGTAGFTLTKDILGGDSGLTELAESNSTAQRRSERRLPACTTRDDDAGKMPALRVCDDFALYC